MLLINHLKRDWQTKRGRATIIGSLAFVTFVFLMVHSPLARAIVGSAFPQNQNDASLTCRNLLFTSKERPVFTLNSAGANRAFVRIYPRTARSIARSNDPHSFRSAAPAPYWLDNVQTAPAIFAQQKPLYEFTAPLRHTDFMQSEGIVTLPQPLPKGDYVVAVAHTMDQYTDAGHREPPSLAWLRVSDLGLIVKRAPEKVLVQAIDLLTNKPLPNVSLSAFLPDDYNDQGYTQPQYKADYITTSNGAVEFPTNGENSEWFISARRDNGDVAAYIPYDLGNYWSISSGQQISCSSINDPYRAFFCTDRTVYRLGQTVNFRCLTAKLGANGIKPIPAGTKVEFFVTDPQGAQVVHQKFSLDEQSALHGSFPISAQGATGSYSARLVIGEYSESESRNEIYANIAVEEYRKPEYEVTIEAVTPNMVTGGKAHCRVKAKYYFGAPVTKAKIHYTATFSPDYSARYRLLERPDYYSFYDRWNSFEYIDAASPESLLPISGSAITNDKGEALVDITVPKLKLSDENNANVCQYYDRNMQVNATVTDLSLKSVEASGSIPVPAAAFNIAIEPMQTWITPGGTITTTVTIQDHDDKAVNRQVVRVKAMRTEKRFLIDKWDQKVFAATTGETDNDGHAKIKIEIPKGMPSGYVTLVAEGEDKEGGRTEDRCAVWVSSDRIAEKTDSEDINVVLDKDVYALGDTAHATISDANIKFGESSHALVSIEGTTIYDRRNVEIKGPITTIDIPLREIYVPNAHLSVAWLDRQHAMQHRDIELKVSPKEKILDIKVSTDKKDYRPGDDAEVNVLVKDSHGKPIKDAELSLALTDESIFAIRAESGETMLNMIYAPIQNYVGTGWNFDGYSIPKPSPIVLWTDGSLLDYLNGMVCASQEQLCRERSICDTRAMAGGAPTPTPAALPAPCLPAPMLQGATNGTIGPMGGGEGFVPPPPPKLRIRTDFRDTAAWFGDVKTDANGIAKVKIKLPDNLTTWRAVAIANTSWLGVGQASIKTTASRDLMARLSLPRFYTEGDEAFITGIVHNYTKQAQKINLSLEQSGNFKSDQTWRQALTVPPDDVAEFRWPIRVTKYGEAKLLMKAIGQTDADGLEMKLPIRDFSYTDFFAKNGVLDQGQNTQPCHIKVPDDSDLGSAKYKLFLSASRIGPVLGNFDTLIDYPYGCTEQTMSRLIPSVVAMRLHKDLGLPLSEQNTVKFNEIYHRSMLKLLEHQNDDGGWGWWQGDTSNPFLTAYVLEGAYMLRQAGFTLDKNMLDNGVHFLKQCSALSAPPATITDVTDRARVMYVLSLYGQKPTVANNFMATPMFKATPEALAYMTLAFHNAKNEVAAKQTYQRLCDLATESAQYMEWDHTAAMNKKLGITHPYDYDYRYTGIETTALALRATLRMEPSNGRRIDQIRDWVLIQRDQNGWNDTKTTSCVFIALLEDELSKGKVRTDFKSAAKLADQVVAAVTFNEANAYGPEKSFSIPVKSREQTMNLDKQGSGRLYYSTVLTCRRPIDPGKHIIPKSLPIDMRVTREFCKLVAVANHIKAVPIKDGDSITAGDTILMRVKINSPVTLPYVKVEAYLPSGAEITSTDPSHGEATSTDDNSFNWWWTHQDILDDRIVFFTTEMPNGPCTFTSLLRMEMPGKFNINPVSVEGMYTRKVRAYSDATQLQVNQTP